MSDDRAIDDLERWTNATTAEKRHAVSLVVEHDGATKAEHGAWSHRDTFKTVCDLLNTMRSEIKTEGRNAVWKMYPYTLTFLMHLQDSSKAYPFQKGLVNGLLLSIPYQLVGEQQ